MSPYSAHSLEDPIVDSSRNGEDRAPHVFHERRRRRPPAPLLAFTAVYVLTCLVGAVLMLANERTFVGLFEYFSGTQVPDLSPAELRVNLALLVAAPALLMAGYFIGNRAVDHAGSRLRAVGDGFLFRDAPWWLPVAVFVVCSICGARSIAMAGGFDNVDAWLNYGRWIEARQQSFRNIGFFSYTNLYLFVPVTAAWCLLVGLRHKESTAGGMSRAAIAPAMLRWTPALISVAFCLMLFQKKAALVALIIVAVARFAHAPPRRTAQRRWALSGVLVALVAVYFATVVLPVVNNAPSKQQIEAAAATKAAAPAGKAQPAPPPAILGSSSGRTWGVTLYALLSPLTRTSAPALYYPVVYPREHPFYGLDMGQDVLGIGVSPDDNLVIWHRLNPHLAGSTAVPFQFSLYSQVGLAGALVGSVVIGVLLAIAWRFARSPWLPREWRSLLTSLALLVAVYLAIDSVRNSVLVSYGIVWPVMFLFALFAASQIVPGGKVARR